MGILFIGGMLFGTILGRFFKVLILVPTCGVAIVLVLTKPVLAEHSAAQSILEIILLVTGLQFGYAVGLISSNMSAVLRGFRKVFASATHSAGSRSLHVR
jgi:hypothetical protein